MQFLSTLLLHVFNTEDKGHVTTAWECVLITHVGFSHGTQKGHFVLCVRNIVCRFTDKRQMG